MSEYNIIQENIIKQLNETSNLLHDTLIKLKLENSDGQFDFVTSPRLSEATDRLVRLSEQIEKIVYQKVG